MSRELTDKHFLELIHRHQSILHKICFAYCHTGADREDLQQEIVLQLWKSYPSFRGQSKFSTWMYRVALNTAMLGLRARKIKYTGLSDQELGIPVAPTEPMDEDSSIKRLYRQISKLKDLDKTIIFLYLEQCSYDEIAEITGISKKNVSVRLTRIRERLRSELRIQNQAS